MTRTARRSALVGGLAVALSVVLAGPALAEDSEIVTPVPDVGIKGALVLYVLVPLAILLVVAGLVWLPNVVRSDRYRPNRGWAAAPLWFHGPPDPDDAVAAAQPGDLVRGGARGSW